jgi:GNAT superfamily N-acetyltransferase
MKLTAGSLELEVRPGTAADAPLLLSFIRAMAEFEKLEVKTTEAELRESLFGPRPAAETLLAFAGERPAAYAIYFFTFSSMLGRRGLWLDDLFVAPEFRGKGVGQALMQHLAEIAVRNGCGRFEWMVLDWNERAIGFYRKLGATLLDDWRICRLVGEKLSSVARGPGLTGSARSLS